MLNTNNDPYTNAIINSIPEEIRDSFTSEQTRALLQAFSHAQHRSQHIVDVRFQIPLYFAQYYVVILMGRDLRTHIQDTLINRRQRSGRAAQIGFIVLMFWLLIAGLSVTAFIGLYLVKSSIGIDLFSDQHLADFLPW